MHTLAGFWISSGETRRIKKKKIQEPPTILRLRLGNSLVNLLPKTAKLGCNPLHTEPVLQLTRKVRRIQKRHGNTTSNIAEHIPMCGSRLLHVQENLRKTTWRLCKIWMWIWLFGWMFMNSTLRAAVHLGKDNDTNLQHAKNHLWDSLGQLFCENKKDWSVNNQKSLVQKHQRSLLWKQLNLKKLRDQQAYCAKELIRSPMLKCTSSPIQFSVLVDGKWSKRSLEE